MRRLGLKLCSWLQKNHELAFLSVLAVCCLGFTFFPQNYVLPVLPYAIAIVSGGVLYAKIRSMISLRVPRTEKVWFFVFVTGCTFILLNLAWPESFKFTASISFILALSASSIERYYRYDMARVRVQRRREQQSKWRVIKRQVLSEWKDRIRWLAGVQHDLRQPLHAIGLLISHPEIEQGKITPELRQRLYACHRWLQELAENTLEATRLELNETRAREISSIDSQDLCNNLLSWLSHLAESKGLHLESLIEPQRIQTDIRRLKRVLGNLLFNAVQHTFEGQILLKYQRLGLTHQFVVKDNGPGISENVLESHSSKSVFGSDLPKAGIGLYVIRKLCAEMDWDLQLINDHGQGTSFIIEFLDSESNDANQNTQMPTAT